MEHHLLGTSLSLLLVMFLFSSILVTSHFPFGRSKQAYTHSNVSCIESERQDFLQFKNGLIDESNHLSSWIGDDCCSWEGIGCHKNTGRVVKLDLQNTKPPFLVNWTNLQYLDLSKNNFSRIQVPTFLGLLKYLRYLNLANAVFDGEIPRHLGNLSCLRHLELGDVNFTSLSSHELGESNFNNYTVPPWLHNLTGLHNLGLSSNHLSGPIHGLFEQMTSLVYLDLGENRFDASTLMSLCNVSTLNYLDLSFNDMQGSIPSEIGQLSKLQVLDISSNSLTGSNKLDGSLKSFPSYIYELDLSQNFLTGHIPLPDVGQTVASTRFLILCDNHFTSSIPEDLCKLENLKYLDLSNNFLFGRVPLCLGNWLDLRVLNLANNILCGQIPSSLGNLGNLQILDLGDNGLTDIIPTWIGERLSNLKFLRFQSNNFHGIISDELCLLSSLRTDLSMHELFGAIPESLSALNWLNFLNLSHSKLSGPIPSGNQIQTLTDPSIYEGNIGLCGKPLPNDCLEHKLPTENGHIHDDIGHASLIGLGFMLSGYWEFWESFRSRSHGAMHTLGFWKMPMTKFA
ncbi:unnamed protein product [Coffea canephora]|uniref:Leucine-rich repeat-containing N-terminal plant-type domain-containing protein n=1 Tax=Coffea canephora TaxID=49390 RepID=A0A068V8L8_COFCA|nr:unnamed protein product [Coffea canephora]